MLSFIICMICGAICGIFDISLDLRDYSDVWSFFKEFKKVWYAVILAMLISAILRACGVNI